MNRQVITIASYTLIEAIRNRLLWLLLVVLVIVFGLTEFLGSLALTESEAIRSGLFGSFLRLFSVFMLCLFVTTSMARESQDKGMEFLLSLPLSRATYYFGKLSGYSSLAVITALIMGLCVSLYTPLDQSLLWSVSLMLELLLISAISLLCLFTFNQVTIAIIAVMSFYLLARSIDAIRLIGNGPLIDPNSVAQSVMTSLMDALAYVLPGLSRFTSSEWLIYHTGQWHDLLPLLGQTVIYLLLASGIGLFDLYRKSL